MEKNTPQGQPLRQPAIDGPKVAVAHVDPCIVYLEVSSADEIPALIACWARSSSEVQKVGGKTYLKLNHVFVLMGTPLPIREGSSGHEGKPTWHFVVHEQDDLVVDSDAARDQIGLSFSIHFQGKSIRGSRGEIKFINQDTDLSLEILAFDKTRTDQAFVKRILEIASEEWPSLTSAKTFLRLNELPKVGVDTNTDLRLSDTEIGTNAQPNEGELIYNCGESLYREGKYKLATETLQLSLRHLCVRYQALNLMGLSFMKRGMLDFAVKLLASAASELLVMDKPKKEIVYNLGLAYEEIKQFDKALEQWKQIYEIDMCYRDVSKRVEEAYGGNDEQAA